MRDLRSLLTFLFIVCMMSCEQGVKEANTIELTKDEVSSAVETLNNALVDPDNALLEKITGLELTYGHSSGNIQSRSEFIDDLINGPFDFLSINTSDQSIHINGNTAIARHIMKAKGSRTGESVDVHIGIIMIFQKQNDSLLLIGRQAYKL